MPPHAEKEGVLRILGTINYLDKFIEHEPAVQGPISQFAQKYAGFVWRNHSKKPLTN